MKKLNLIRKTSLVIALLALVVVSCKDEFLDVPATGSLANAQLATKAGIEGTLIGSLCGFKWRFWEPI